MFQEEVGLQHYIEVFWRRKWVVLSIFTIVFSISAVWISMSKTSYRVNSLVAVKNQLYYRQPLLTYAPGADRPDQTLHGESYVEVINGLPFSEKVANALALRREPTAAEPEEVHVSLRAEFKEPDLILIHASHIDPNRAVVFANTAADAFVQESRDNIRADLVSYAQYAQAQMEQYQKEVALAEEEIARFKESLGFVNINDEIQNLKTTIVAFEKEAAAVGTQIEIAEAKQREIRKLARLSGAEGGSVLLDDPQVEQLRKLQTVLSEARLRYTESHPTVVNIRAQIREIEGKLRLSLEESGSAISPERYLGLRDELIKTEAALADLRTAQESWARQIGEVRRRLSDFPEKQYKLEILEVRATEAKQRYNSWRDRVDDANSKASTVQGNASIVDYAKSARPATRKSTSLALAFIVSLMLALGFGFVSEFADSTVRTPDEITRTVGLGFLGSIIRMKEPRQVVFADGKGMSNVSEAYTKIYSNIKFASVEGPLRSLLLTSARKGEGKSTTLVNLCCAIAASGKRLVVVDTDLRNPTVQRILGTRHSKGVTSVLAGECSLDEAIQPSGHPGLALLPSGPIPPNPAELIQSQAMKDLIASLEAKYDLVIFDSPPALLVADAMLLASELDGAILVSESGGVTRKELQHVRDTLQVAKARILGVILNKVQESPGGYYYNYYSYYRYYQDAEEKTSEPAGALGWLRDSMKSLTSRTGGRS